MGSLALLLKALAGASAGVIILGYFGIVKKFRFIGRFTVYLLIMAICAILGFIEGSVLSLVNKNGIVQYVTARTFYTLCKFFLNIRIEIQNPERLEKRPIVLISNHQSMLDILILGATFPKWCSVTAKKSLKYYPFLGWFMLASKTVFLDRQRRDSALKTFDGARNEVLKDRQSVFMFPEGTRSHARDLKLLPFKKGAFHFAQQCQIPIVPFVVANYSNIYSFKRHILETGVIPVEVLEPIETVGKTPADVNDLLTQATRQMEEAVARLGYAKQDNNITRPL